MASHEFDQRNDDPWSDDDSMQDPEGNIWDDSNITPPGVHKGYVLGSHLLEADALPQAGDISDNTDPVSNMDMSPDLTPSNSSDNGMNAGDQMGMGPIPAQQPIKASRWTTADFKRVLATDSDLYELGYKDRLEGKDMDQGLSNLSQDYYQGYQQAGFYFEVAQQSAPQNLQDMTEGNNELPRNPVASRQGATDKNGWGAGKCPQCKSWNTDSNPGGNEATGADTFDCMDCGHGWDGKPPKGKRAVYNPYDGRSAEDQVLDPEDEEHDTYTGADTSRQQSDRRRDEARRNMLGE